MGVGSAAGCNVDPGHLTNLAAGPGTTFVRTSVPAAISNTSQSLNPTFTSRSLTLDFLAKVGDAILKASGAK